MGWGNRTDGLEQSKMSTRDVSFGTFNLYNLQIADEPMYGGKRYDQNAYAAKVKWLSTQLRRLDADIIAFQELWSRRALLDVFQESGLDSEYELIFIKDEWYSIAVAAAVRRPWKVTKKQTHKAFPSDLVIHKRRTQRGEDDDVDVNIDQFSRTVLDLEVAHVEEDDVPPIRVFAGHLKSKLPTRLDQEERNNPDIARHADALGTAISTIRRTAEAAALRVILNTVMDDTQTPVVVLGDLNDGPDSNTLDIVTDSPPFRLYEKSRTGWSSERGLYSAGHLQQLRSLRDVYYTYWYKGKHLNLDHILVSEQFYDFSTDRKWSFKETRIWNDFLDDDDPATTDHGVMRASFVWHTY